MLTQLATIKTRLAIPAIDATYDGLLTTAIQAVSARFDHECNRAFARQPEATFDFPAHHPCIAPPRYPVESVSKFELKFTEAEGWLEQPGVDYLIRHSCVISLFSPLCPSRLPSWASPLARITYTAGYVLPGTAPEPGQTSLPQDLEYAAIEQVACWFQNRETLGLIRHWPANGTYKVFPSTSPILPAVRSILSRYARVSI